jgi:glycosyltransferase involved in cell wall biosynthesis
VCNGADVVVLNGSRAGFLGRLIKIRAPRMFCVVHLPSWFQKNRPKAFVFWLLELCLAHYAPWVDFVPIAEWMGPYLMLRLLLRRHRVHVVTNGLDGRWVSHDAVSHDAVGRERIRERFGWREDEFVCLAVARYDYQKNLGLVLNAFGRAFQGDDHCRLVVLGIGRDVPKVPDCVRSSVTLAGHVDNVRDYMVAADVFVSASRFEGLPLAVLQAKAVGMPMLLSAVPGNVEASMGACAQLVRRGSTALWEKALMVSRLAARSERRPISVRSFEEQVEDLMALILSDGHATTMGSGGGVSGGA